VWEVPGNPRSVIKYRLVPGPKKVTIGASASRSVSIDLETGEQTPLKMPPAETPPVPRGNEYVTAQGREISFHRAGKVAWTHTAGDVLLQPPILVDGLVLAAVKNNVILALDAAVGKVKASRKWPTWLREVAAIGSGEKRRIVCTDLRKRVSMLSWPELEIICQLEFPFHLEKGMMLRKSFPMRWHGADMLGERKPALLIIDEKGYLYILDPEARSKQ